MEGQSIQPIFVSMVQHSHRKRSRCFRQQVHTSPCKTQLQSPLSSSNFSLSSRRNTTYWFTTQSRVGGGRGPGAWAAFCSGTCLNTESASKSHMVFFQCCYLQLNGQRRRCPRHHGAWAVVPADVEFLSKLSPCVDIWPTHSNDQKESLNLIFYLRDEGQLNRAERPTAQDPFSRVENQNLNTKACHCYL